MVRVLGHRQTKGAATDHPSLPPPRHISTLQIGMSLEGRKYPFDGHAAYGRNRSHGRTA